MRITHRRGIVHLVTLIAAFGAGWVAEHARAAYHYEVVREQSYPYPLGNITWRFVHEYVGAGFLDPGRAILEFDGRRIYSAQRYFQEGIPVARDVVVAGNHVTWQDGEYGYDLAITKMTDDDRGKPPQ